MNNEPFKCRGKEIIGPDGRALTLDCETLRHAELVAKAMSYGYVRGSLDATRTIQKLDYQQDALPRLRFPLCAFLNPQQEGRPDHAEDPTDEIWLEWSTCHLRIILGPYESNSPDLFIERRRDPRPGFRPQWTTSVHPGGGLDQIGTFFLTNTAREGQDANYILHFDPERMDEPAIRLGEWPG